MLTPVELLAKSPLFASLSPQHREQIAAHFTRHEVATGTEIVRQNDPGDALYLLESGAVGVFVRDPQLGIQQLVSTLEAPDAFGEMALVTAEPRSATCTAMSPCVVHRLGAEIFKAVVQQVPSVALGVAQSLALRLKRVTADHEVPWVSLSGRKFDPRLWSLVPGITLFKNKTVPLTLDGRTLTVAMVDPLDGSALDPFRQALPGVVLRIVAVSADDFQRFVEGGAGKAPRAEVVATPAQRPVITFPDDIEAQSGRSSLSSIATGPQIVALVEDILGTGLAIRASDIHIELERRGVVVRYRVEGDLRPRQQPIPPEFAKPLLSRLKLLAKLDNTEARRPQDGRVSLRAGNKPIDLRVSSIPAKLGEKIVMRILDAEANLVELKSLFAADRVRQFFQEMVNRRHGLVLVTGPTGSGKTTTLYSALMARRKPEINIVTVEDPIEYHIDDITQIQVQPDVGTTFAVVLRALMRQDPDVILVGETRDHETAVMAVEAAMTGHLVLTSLHTNGAIEAIMRLTELGVARQVLANTLVGSLHQRLVRKICPACTEPFECPPGVVERMVKLGCFLPQESPTFARGKGCPACNGTGFKGRVAVFEVLGVNDAVRAAIESGADGSTIRDVASKGSMVELARYAGILVGSGLTMPSEVLPLLHRTGA